MGGELGGEWNHVLRTHLSEIVRGSYSSTPAFRLLSLGLCTEGRG